MKKRFVQVGWILVWLAVWAMTATAAPTITKRLIEVDDIDRSQTDGGAPDNATVATSTGGTMSLRKPHGGMFPWTNEYDRTIRPGNIVTAGPWVDAGSKGTITVGVGASTAQRAANAAAIQAAHDSLDTSSGGTIMLPPGMIYIDNNTVNISSHRVRIWGQGKHTTTVYTSGTAFSFLRNPVDGSSLSQCAIGRMAIGGTGSAQKVGIVFEDVSIFHIVDLATVSATMTGNNSIGILSKGKESVTFTRLDIMADQPLQLSDNSRNASIDADHYHIEDCNFGSELSTNYNLLIDDGICLFNFVIDGRNSGVLGKGFLYWNDTSRVQSPVVFHVTGVRYEQQQDNTGYIFYVATSTGNTIQSFNLTSNYGSAAKGVYLRGILSASLIENTFPTTAGGVALDVNDSVSNLYIVNHYANPSTTVSITGLYERFYVPLWVSGDQTGIGFAVYNLSGPGGLKTRIENVTHTGKVFALDNTTAEVWSLRTRKTGLLTVVATSPTDNTQIAAHVIVPDSEDHPWVLWDNTGPVAVSNTAGNFCIIPGPNGGMTFYSYIGAFNVMAKIEEYP